MSHDFNIPDNRSGDPGDYAQLDRRGQMKRSWSIGVSRRDSIGTLSFDDGLTWGSIGQILGYLLGNVDDGFQNELYDRLRSTSIRNAHRCQLEMPIAYG